MTEPRSDEAALSKGWLSKSGGVLAAGALAGANLVGVLTNVDKIRQFLWEQLGLLGIENLYGISIVLVLGALTIYLLGASVVYVLAVRGRRRLAYAYWSVVALLAPIIGYVTFNEFGPVGTSTMVSRQVVRLKETTMGQFTPLTPTSGAFRFSLAQMTDMPQGWTSAQALAGILASPAALEPAEAVAVRQTLNYLHEVRTAGGWGYRDGDLQGITEIAGWVVLAEAMSLDEAHSGLVWPEGPQVAVDRVVEHLDALVALQHADGGWAPVQRTDDRRHQRTFSTATAMMALLEARRRLSRIESAKWTYDDAIRRGVRWLLLNAQTSEEAVTGWFPNPSLPRQSGECLGLTAEVMFVLQEAAGRPGVALGDQAFDQTRRAFLDQALRGAAAVSGASNVGTRDFHFNCRVHDTDIYLPGIDFRLEPSTFLWYPWTLAAVSSMRFDSSLSAADRNKAKTLYLLLLRRMEEATDSAHNDQALYVVAETLLAANISLRSEAGPN